MTRDLRLVSSRPYIDPRRIALATKDGRAVRNPPVELRLHEYRSRYDDERASPLARAVTILSLSVAAWCVVYFGAELLRSAF